MKSDFFHKKKPKPPRIIKIGEIFLFIDSFRFRRLVEKKVRQINKNSNLPFKLLMSHNDKIIEGNANIKFIENYMSYDYYSSKWELVFSGYPNDECGMVLTKMKVDLSDYNVLGLEKGMQINEAEKKLSAYGFEKTIESYMDFMGYTWTHTYYKYLDIKLYLHNEDDKTSSLTLQVETYYVGNRIY